ncbi:MAG: helix-turn-helix transcriptional regulator [Candidatus Gastranaerophilales bacterium]|nr:helix-turn-helix transcriptional regulator [Candidatus Gastranaerophilales bacterium]MCM1073394.1 helix-turn-helix transcriptional regulator [Bacteroides sp.]
MLNETDFRRILALNVRIERFKKNMTQEQLAELANVSHKHITKIENSGVTPSIYLIYRVASVLNVSIDKLLREPD